jgi:hypothetical protein
MNSCPDIPCLRLYLGFAVERGHIPEDAWGQRTGKVLPALELKSSHRRSIPVLYPLARFVCSGRGRGRETPNPASFCALME